MTPAVAVACLLAVTVVLAGVAGAVALQSVPEPGSRAALTLSVSGDRVTLTHRGGDTLDVRTLRVRVTVDGVPLAAQPPVPFFAARGFESGPTGPFNVAADPRWTAGETASFAVAGTNDPVLAPGAVVVVTVTEGETTVARLRTRVDE